MPNLKINSFFTQKLKEQATIFPSSEISNLQFEAEMFSALGVESEKEYHLALQACNFIPKIAKEICPFQLSSNQIGEVLLSAFQKLKNNKNTSLQSFYFATKQAFEKNNIPLRKIAYPNDQISIIPAPEYNLQKWMETMKKVYSGLQKGLGYNNSLELCTEGWDEVERQDFKAWVNFYSQGEHLKYKTANKFGQYLQAPGINIPMEHLVSSLPTAPQTGISSEPTEQEISHKKVLSLIGRLNAAEKLFTDLKVQKYLGQRGVKVEDCLEALHALKRKIQSASFRVLAALVEDLEFKTISKTATDKLLEDFLYREFYRIGLKQPEFLVKYAIENKLGQASPTPSPPGPLPTNPGAPTNPPPPNNLPLDGQANEPMPDEGELAVEEFIAGLNGEDVSSVWDDEIEMDEPSHKKSANKLYSYAQVVPPNLPVPEKVNTNPFQAGAQIPALPNKDLGLQKSENIFESVLKHVKVSDVIERLEALADVFRNREISRQMAIIDLFMDRLGIATFFPTLAEASTKTLESNQYALTRIEDIISKLRGSVDIPEKNKIILDKDNDVDRPAPEVDPNLVKNKLQQNEIKESIENENEARQELGQPIENQNQPGGSFQNQPVPNPQADLAGPIPIQAPQQPVRR